MTVGESGQSLGHDAEDAEDIEDEMSTCNSKDTRDLE